jgi:transcriptional regulator with XRE-family HTH domain
MVAAKPDQTPDDDEQKYVMMGARLRQAREFLGLSQEAVAEALGIPRASISAMETGRRKVSSLELRDLAHLYKRPLDWFYASETEPIDEDETVVALFRATRTLNQEDKEQVLRFAEFLKGAGQAPARRRNQ